MVPIHVSHVVAGILDDAMGLRPVLALASPASKGAAPILVGSRERNIATSASFTSTLFLPITASLLRET
jgi:hypothetical protein